jgi:hypothetical protein
MPRDPTIAIRDCLAEIAVLSGHSWTGQRIEIVRHKRRGSAVDASPSLRQGTKRAQSIPCPSLLSHVRPARNGETRREKSFVVHSVIRSATSCVQARRGKLSRESGLAEQGENSRMAGKEQGDNRRRRLAGESDTLKVASPSSEGAAPLTNPSRGRAKAALKRPIRWSTKRNLLR